MGNIIEAGNEAKHNNVGLKLASEVISGIAIVLVLVQILIPDNSLKYLVIGILVFNMGLHGLQNDKFSIALTGIWILIQVVVLLANVH